MRIVPKSAIGKALMHEILQGLAAPQERHYLYRHRLTGECHLFRGTFDPTMKTCVLDQSRESYCKGMMLITADERKAEKIFGCLDEQEARDTCAKLGREVCGNCIGHLYATAQELLIDP